MLALVYTGGTAAVAGVLTALTTGGQVWNDVSKMWDAGENKGVVGRSVRYVEARVNEATTTTTTTTTTTHGKKKAKGKEVTRTWSAWLASRTSTVLALFAAGALVSGLAYLLTTYMQRYRRRVAESDAKSVRLGREAREQECVSDHFSSLQRLPGLSMAPLRCAVRANLDLSHLTAPLVRARHGKRTDDDLPLTPAAKLRLWEQYKVSALARVLLSELAMVSTILLLRVHLNLLGRQLFLAGDDADAEREGLTEQTQQYFLLLAEGTSGREATLKDLSRAAVNASEKAIGNVSLKAKLTQAELRKIIVSGMKELTSAVLGTSAKVRGGKGGRGGLRAGAPRDEDDDQGVLASFLREGISASAEDCAGRLDAAEMLALKNLSHQASDVMRTSSCRVAVMHGVGATHDMVLRRMTKDVASHRGQADVNAKTPPPSTPSTPKTGTSPPMRVGDEEDASAHHQATTTASPPPTALDTPTPLAKLIPSMERASLDILDDCEELEESMANDATIVAFFADVYAGATAISKKM